MMTTEDLKQLTDVIDAARHDAREISHVVFSFRHDFTDDPLPYVYDYLTRVECRVVNLFTLVLPGGQIHREFVVRRPGRSANEG